MNGQTVRRNCSTIYLQYYFYKQNKVFLNSLQNY